MESYQGVAIALLIVLIVMVLWTCTREKRNKDMSNYCNNYVAGDNSTDVNMSDNKNLTPGTRHQRSEFGSGYQSRNLDSNYADLINNEESTDDYNNMMQKMSLESEVSDSHKRFVKDVTRSTSGAAGASMTVRSDDNDINPWVGLRRPRYRTPASANSDARTVHSEYPDQMYGERAFTILS